MKTVKFKIILITGGLLLMGINLSAQRSKIEDNPAYGPDSASRMECAMNLSIMNEYVKIESYGLAVDAWHKCFTTCPGSSKNIYISGAKVIKYKIENETDAIIQSAWIDTLLLLYDKRIQYFQEEGKVNGYKGLDLIRYHKTDVEKAYGFLEKSVNLSGDKVDESVAVTFISATYILMQQNILGPEVMINNYVKIMDLLDRKMVTESGNEKIAQTIESIEKVFSESGAADCESLISIFTPKFNENPVDIGLLKKITGLLAQTNCKESALYAQAAEALFRLEPSADAAAKLGSLFSIKEQYSKANEYFNKAIEQETEPGTKASYYFQLAQVAWQQRDYPTVRKHCLSAIDLKNNYGDAYILIGRAYIASGCGDSDFEKQTIYWAAVDKFIKAKSVDPSVKETADDLINTYSQHFPNQETAFFNSCTDGQPYRVGCWIQESTIIRTIK
jgi:tetratricopeptide (TPR) repeat protein